MSEDKELRVPSENGDQTKETDLEIFQKDLLQFQQPDPDFHIVPDRVRSLENYIDFLSESISIGSISQDEFDNEILKTTYYLDTLTKKYNIVTEEKQKIIEDARILRKEAIEAYKIGAISEEKFNEVYTNAIRTEYSILKSSEIESTEDSTNYRVDSMEDLSTSEKLEKLEKMEATQIRNVAKKYKVVFPKIPANKTKIEIDLYYKNKITGKRQEYDLVIETYIDQYSEAKKIVDYHTTSFEVSKIFYNPTIGKADFEFKLVQSIRGDIEKIRREDAKQQLLDPQEMAYVDRMNELKSMLRKMSRIDLIKCTDTQLYELLTFIEKLRSNKQYVFKFKTRPIELDIELKITEDNEYYKLPPEKLLSSYNYVRPNIYTIEDTAGTINFTETGDLGYLALKAGKNPLKTLSNVEDEEIDMNDYVTVVPFSDELYSKLKTTNATNTEVIEIWELHLDFIDSSKKILRYTSFEDFLLVFKRLMINKCKLLKKIDDEQVLELITKQTVKYPRLKPRTSPFLLSQQSQRKIKSFEELRYEYYSNVGDKTGEVDINPKEVDINPKEVKIDLNPVAVKSSSPLDELDDDIKSILNKIMQIEYYLIFKLDKQQTSPTSQISPVELLEETEINKIREFGLEKLTNYISLTDPGAENIIKEIESDIFSFSSKNYTFNIKKIIFLFDNFPEKKEDIILSKRNGNTTGQSNITELLVYETPYNLEAEKIGNVKTDAEKQSKIAELLEWKPNVSNYDNYKDELSGSNHDFKKFRKSHPELKNIELNEIMSEYAEKIQWENSIKKYNSLEVPSGMIELNFRLRFLLRQRNRLASRRIFKLASISTRLEQQENLERTYGVCKLTNYKKISLHTERIIYSLSKTPEDYMYYNYIVNSKFKLICESLIALENSDIIDEYLMISIIIKFIINNGDFNKSDIEKLIDFSKEITEETKELYISTLARDELRAQEAYRISQIDSGESTNPDQDLMLDASRIAESERDEAIRLQLVYRSNNTYIPPVIYDVLPDDTGIEKYFIINGQYICGGFYPPFYRWDENLVSYENYTRSDLTTLSTTFAIPFLNTETNYQIYEKIRNFIDSKVSSPGNELNLLRSRFNEDNEDNEDTSGKAGYLKIPIKTIMYTMRSRYGVPDPGEVYNVILDKTNVYGVPFKFQNGIPVYSMKLKQLVDNRFVIIEGPSLYEDTVEINFLRSNYYILIEYTDPRGTKILFKEGVAQKKIIKKNPGYSACERFDNRIACDDPNSYSLEIKGKRYKCQWKEKCGIRGDTSFFLDIEEFDINKVGFVELYKQRDWANALETSLRYIQDKIISEQLSPENIDILKKNQKAKLFNYYKKLYDYKFQNEIGQSGLASASEVVHDKSFISEFKDDILKPDPPIIKNIPDIQEGYVQHTLYRHKKIESIESVGEIILNSVYNTYINGTYVNIVPFMFIPDKNLYKCTLDDGSAIEVSQGQIYNVLGNILKVIPIFCIVKKEDYPFLNKRIGYSWIHREKLSIRRYDSKGEPEILTKETETEKFDIPSNFIEPTSNLPGPPIITRDNIFEAMYKTAFNTLSNSINQLIYTTVVHFDATLEAKKFAVINRIDLRKIIKIGTIGIEDIQRMPDMDYVVKTITPGQILTIIMDAITDKNVPVLSQYYLMGVRAEIDKNILREAKNIIDSYKQPVETEQLISTKQPDESRDVVSYVTQRPGKLRVVKEE
jgi:hypothetical protein